MKARVAHPDDLPVLLKFEQGVIAEERPCNEAIRKSDVIYYDLDKFLTDPDTSLQVVEHEGQLVGCGYAQLRASEAPFTHERHSYMGFMYVEPAFRGQGVNKMIIESLIDWSKEQGVYDFYLEVYTENQAAIRAYEKSGFEATLLEMKIHLGNT